MDYWLDYFDIVKHLVNDEIPPQKELISTEGFLKYCRYHRITNRIYPRAKPYLTETGLRLFKIAVARSTQKGLNMAATLKTILSTLHDANIPAMPFKGPSLSQLVYGAPSTKESRDMDVFIAITDIQSAEIALNSIGFYRASSLSNLSKTAELCHQKIFKDLSFFHKDSKLCLELHWNLNPTLALTNDATWALTTNSTFLGVPIKQLNTLDYFIYLCLHGSHSLWKRWSWWLDAKDYYLKFQDELSSALITQRAKTLGAYSSLLLANTMFTRLGGASILPAADSFKTKLLFKMAKRELAKTQESPKGIIATNLFRIRRERYITLLYSFRTTLPQRALFQVVLKHL